MKSAKILLASLTILTASLSGCNVDSNNNNGAGYSYGNQHIFGTAEAALADGSASMARFSNPANVAVARDGTVFVADYDNNAIRAILSNGLVLTVIQRDNFQRPFGLTIANDDTVYVETDGNDMGQRDATTGTIWKIDRNTGAVTLVVRNIGRPRGLVALPDGRIAMSDLVQNTISVMDPSAVAPAPTVIAGTAGQNGLVNGTGAAARFDRPYGMSLASDGALLVADQNNNVIRHVTLAGVVTTFAGSMVNAPAAATSGNANGAAATASFNAPEALAVDGDTVYVADQGNHIIRKIAAGVVSTQAGNGTAGFVDAQGLAAEFYGLEGIAAGPDGRLWIADGNVGDPQPYNRVRYIPIP
jgi:sugar lactone lactonase YvrE